MLYLWLYLGGAAVTSFTFSVLGADWSNPGPFFGTLFWPIGLPAVSGTWVRERLRARRARLERAEHERRERLRLEFMEREKLLNAPLPE